ncbi:hypothetical protein GQX73_g2767 [Xylaria multiplex]|uniref:Protein kinase domain-containing protein n=1 Tax=Xylaria multiplex TaxID=323545 RepID=A0A7C8MXC9_9PEZI|nr:hypothetical protein GQX73_g2767 [Xylaria multiplex]
MSDAPPPDPDRPPSPYVPGFAMQITEHYPPAPFGEGGHGPSKHPYIQDWPRRTPQTRIVLTEPPQETQWSSETSPRSAVLTIAKTISVGEARGTQVVACDLLIRGQEQPYTVVAKIYDALYYSYYDDENVVELADKHYSREAHAYMHLEATKALQQPGFAPEYYGSWTFQLPLPAQGKIHTRAVRLVLIERLSGSSLLELFRDSPTGPNAFHLDEAYRYEVLTNILVGVAKQMYSGLSQNDLAQRNVMLVPGPQEDAILPQSVPRVVLIDYNIAIIHEKTKYGRRSYSKLSQPPNPAKLFWSSPPVDLQGWYCTEWLYRKKNLYRKWLLERFSGSNAADFAPITVKLEFDDEEPDNEPRSESP